jgi:hypothetical protein
LIFKENFMRSSETISFTFEDRVRNGMLDRRSARQEQDKHTGRAIQMEGAEKGGWVVKLNSGGGKMNFDNLAAGIEWTKKSGGLVYGPEGNLLAGTPVEELPSQGSK